MAISIVDYMLPDDTHNLYDVNFFSDSIHTIVTDTPSYVSGWISDIESLHFGRLIVGLDVEWRPSYNRYIENPVATLQLCVGKRCLIFQILHAPSIPQALFDFLLNPSYTFVGVGIESDIEKLTGDYGLGVANWVDLRGLAAEKSGNRVLINAGLKDLAREVLGREIVKPRHITMSRWDNQWLTPPQMVSNVIRASVVGASSSVLAIATVVLKRKRTSTSRPREPKVDQEIARERYMKSILCRGEQHCVDQIRMKPSVFFKLCETLEEKNLLQKTRNMSIKEQVLMFLHLVGHNVRLRVIGGRFYRSIETVHRYFKIVLRAILMLFNLVVRQPDDSTPTEIRYNNRFYPYFKDCIGAIDGSLIRAKVSEQLAGRFRGRKGGTTQNILATISFDLKFTYVLAGWEGSAHDSRIIRDALERPGGLVIPEGKYYLGDAGYGIRNGIISPYRGVRYHLKEFSDENPPQNAKELFNLRHSSLRTTIERGFGILKKRFRVLDSEPHWSYEVQVDIVLACCVIHNFIMGVDPTDIIINDPSCEVESRSQGVRAQLTQRQEREEFREWTTKRDNIAKDIWDDYVATI